MAAIATHTYPKYCGCGITGRKPNKMLMKKLIMMHLSILLKSFFPFKLKVRKTSVGALLSHSPHNTAGVPTLNNHRLRNQKYTETVLKYKHLPKNVDANSIPFEEKKC